MSKATSIADFENLVSAVSAAGGAVPDRIGCLLSAHRVLSAPRAAHPPEGSILDHAMAGTLDEKTLDKLIGPAAIAAMTAQYRTELAHRSEAVLVGQLHRELTAGAADQILDSLRDNFDKHAKAIQAAKKWINPESSIEHLIESGQPELVTAWNELPSHIGVVSKIGTIAAEFGCKPQARFSQIRMYGGGDDYKVSDRALFCTNGGLVADSAPFLVPDGPGRASAWFRVSALKLHSVASARERHDQWAAAEFDRVNSRDPGGYIAEDGQVHPFPRPVNPYRQTADA